ncbi:hypothetical protein DC31_12410 [Microbacterium sp. CH12i]|uniref:DUF4166 domain-containing protein n=1 Tax=Microbacterium sp. CH12i TaxID=1479651 RepID=UPI000460EE50|nr:DUF4166 domain-containing protein [Microbacterium sp. CH12i]KDA06176.1 hypothetical protein DC31_12410 [Microbacterium sp. CH12i]
MSVRSSVYLEALGSDAQRLQPEVFAYIAGPPEGQATGVGEGIFEIAGSRWGWLSPLIRLVIGPGLLVSRHEQDVPFDIVNRPFRMPSGAPALAAERHFQFRNSTQTVVDVMFVASHREPSSMFPASVARSRCSWNALRPLRETSDCTREHREFDWVVTGCGYLAFSASR